MSIKFPLLTADQIEVKIKQCTEKGAVALLYKTARTDMELLDSTLGAGNWFNEYTEVKGNLFCTIYMREDAQSDWVAKQDCGIESRADSDGNEKKGEASDAFKRAGFRCGIGRELYTAPFVFLKVATMKNDRGKYDLVDRYKRYSVSSIGYDEQSRINDLVVADDAGTIVYTLKKTRAGQPSKNKPVEEKQPTQPASSDPNEELTNQRKAEWDRLPGGSKGRAATIWMKLKDNGHIADKKKLGEYTENEYLDMMALIDAELSKHAS